MELAKIKIPMETLQMLVDSDVITTNDFEVVSVDEKDFDYSQYPHWVDAKAKSDKAFKELKKIEWAIRNR